MFKKEAVEPSYLNNEEEFVRSASRWQRQAFLQENENRFWSSFTKKYKWETSQNITFMDKLKREPDLLQKYEAARRGIISTTRTNLWALRTELLLLQKKHQLYSLYSSMDTRKQNSRTNTFAQT